MNNAQANPYVIDIVDPLRDMWGYKDLTIKFIIIYDDEGNYVIHGQSNVSVEEMFSAMKPLWNLDPSKETVNYIELNTKIPLYGSQRQLLIETTDGPITK